MKRLTYLMLFMLLAVVAQAQQAKYVFYFIGDGMGLNQVNTTEMYLGEKQGRIGTEPLCFASFPVAGMATSYSATNSITDSSAGGTALATGVKTYNGAIGVDANKERVMSVAERAKRAGKKVGVTTSVSVDHATPAAFYGHQPDRSMYYEIALQLPEAGFDFKAFYLKLKERGFVIYPGKISQADTFRIGNIGDVFPDDFRRLVEAIKEIR